MSPLSYLLPLGCQCSQALLAELETIDVFISISIVYICFCIYVNIRIENYDLTASISNPTLEGDSL